MFVGFVVSDLDLERIVYLQIVYWCKFWNTSSEKKTRPTFGWLQTKTSFKWERWNINKRKRGSGKEWKYNCF